MSRIIFAIFSDFEGKILMTLRERIKMLCKQNGISLNKLEVECDFAKGYLSKLDKSTPNMAYLQKIANYFGVTTDFLLTGEEKEKADYSTINAELADLILTDKKLSEALQVYEKLNSVQKDAIINMINSYKTNK